MTKTAVSVWNECLSFIKDNIKPQAYKTWFEPIKPIKISGEALTIQVPSKFFYEWLEEHYIKLLRVALVRELGSEAKLIYDVRMENTYSSNSPQTVKIPSSNRNPMKSQKVTVPLESKRELKNPFIIPGLQKVKIESQLNASYNFDNFVEGDSNRLARSAGMAVANKPGGTSFNPLLIYGGVGLGKTHLAHAIGVDIKDKYGLVLKLESALSDVLSIIGTITVLEIIETGIAVPAGIFQSVLQSFSLAIIVGIICGIIWVYLLKKHGYLMKAYMLTIALVIGLYVFVESDFVGGSGPIAALTFGLVLGNSRVLLTMGNSSSNNDIKNKPRPKLEEKTITNVLSNSAKNFYSEISFFVNIMIDILICIVFVRQLSLLSII